MENKRHERVLLSDLYVDSASNCRGKVLPIDVIELKKSIAERGLIQPVVVTPLAPTHHSGKKYLLVAGFRRTEAHRNLYAESRQDPKWATIEAIVQEGLTEEDVMILNLTENVSRADLNILQEAKALKRLLATYPDVQKVAQRLGKTKSWIDIRMNLLSMPEQVQQEAAAGFLTQKHIVDLFNVYKKSGYQDTDRIFALVRKIKDRKLVGDKRTVEVIKKPVTSAVRRDKTEIIKMQDFMREKVGNGLHTQVAAWAAGNISTLEMYIAIKMYAAENDKRDFEIPAESL